MPATIPSPAMRQAVDYARHHAVTNHAQHRQYDGHWDDPKWRPIVMKRRIRTKFGVSFEKGDISIGYYQEPDESTGMTRPGYFVYSFRNGIDTWVPVNAVRVVD